WLSSMTGAQPTWIQYEFDRVYKLHQMWVWNHNTSIEPILGFGVKDVTIEYSSDGANWATLDTTHEFARAPGMPGYAHNTTVDMAGVPAKYVKLTANSNWGGVLPQYGLSEVRFFYIPVLAREPDPASGATDVPVATIGQTIDVFLSFIAGREAASHNVYFSTDQQAVIDGTAPVTTVSQASYGPLSLDLDKTYYWRVDEVNEAETPTTWQGNVWNFSTQKSLVVDDFEDYNDFEPDRIFDTWIDGWGVATNGSQVGYAEPSFVEKKIVHGGAQSMPFFYDNTGGVAYSEAERTWAVPQDWNWKGVTALVLWFRGNPVAFQESPPGTFTMSADGADIWGSRDEFRYAYKQLNGNGSIVAQVLSVDHTHNWAKAGPMIRETLDPGSKFAAVYITPGNGCRFQLRSTTNGSASSDSSVATAEQKAITAAYWVKLERSGNAFSAYYSSDPATDPWHLMVWSPQTIAMPPNVYIGLALTSHASGVTCVAKFSDVSTTGAVTGPWQVAEIGVAQPANTAAPLYVSLADSANKTATVKHPDAAATTISAWTQWNVDLAEFTGVNPRSIKKMIIGVGDKANPQPASGLVYFDDIGLYPPQPAQ
ncbi:MAG: discoidin domain-containing protein, partial [Sedimentisphaerales bacterium]